MMKFDPFDFHPLATRSDKVQSTELAERLFWGGQYDRIHSGLQLYENAFEQINYTAEFFEYEYLPILEMNGRIVPITLLSMKKLERFSSEKSRFPQHRSMDSHEGIDETIEFGNWMRQRLMQNSGYYWRTGKYRGYLEPFSTVRDLIVKGAAKSLSMLFVSHRTNEPFRERVEYQEGFCPSGTRKTILNSTTAGLTVEWSFSFLQSWTFFDGPTSPCEGCLPPGYVQFAGRSTSAFLIDPTIFDIGVTQTCTVTSF